MFSAELQPTPPIATALSRPTRVPAPPAAAPAIRLSARPRPAKRHRTVRPAITAPAALRRLIPVRSRAQRADARAVRADLLSRDYLKGAATAAPFAMI